jgi:hypothetical protein
LRRQLKRQKDKPWAGSPMRRCIGCQKSFPQDQLMRFTLRGSEIVPDISGKNDGRGMYLCRNQDCIDRAVKRKAFCRVCRAQVDMESVTRAIEAALNTN